MYWGMPNSFLALKIKLRVPMCVCTHVCVTELKFFFPQYVCVTSQNMFSGMTNSFLALKIKFWSAFQFDQPRFAALSSHYRMR